MAPSSIPEPTPIVDPENPLKITVPTREVSAETEEMATLHSLTGVGFITTKHGIRFDSDTAVVPKWIADELVADHPDQFEIVT